MFQHIGSDSSAKGVGDDDNFVEVVCSEDLGYRKTGRLTIEWRAGYPIADWENLTGAYEKEEH